MQYQYTARYTILSPHRSRDVREKRNLSETFSKLNRKAKLKSLYASAKDSRSELQALTGRIDTAATHPSLRRIEDEEAT